MKSKRYYTYGISILLGALAGYLYWFYIGCNSGTCAITSKWVNSSIYGAVLGYLLGSLLFDVYEKRKKNAQNEHV